MKLKVIQIGILIFCYILYIFCPTHLFIIVIDNFLVLNIGICNLLYCKQDTCMLNNKHWLSEIKPFTDFNI